MTSGVDRLDVDAGLTAAIGDYVWEDLDANGYQDDLEPGLSGVTVTLERHEGGDWVVVGEPVTTPPSGAYLFTEVGAGEYRVRFARSYWEFSPNTDPDTERNSDPDPETGVTEPFQVGAAGRSDIDAGLYRRASVAKRVWNDLNEDGYRGDGEPPVAGVTVWMLDANGTRVKNTPTNSAGEYEFAGLIPGDYGLEFVRPSYFAFTQRRTDTPDDRNSDVYPDTGLVSPFTLESGEHRADLDAGLVEVASASVSGKVWRDTNADGFQDPNEQGLPGLTVQLRDAAGGVIVTKQTGPDGSYSFPDLVSGAWTVKVVTTDRVGPRLAWPDETKDNDAYSDATIPVTLAPGEQVTHRDAGLYRAAEISGRVWLDKDGSGRQEPVPGEDPVPGVVVTLYDAKDNPVGTSKTTGTDGKYAFPGLDPAGYRVGFQLPSDLHFTKQVEGYADTDSDVVPTPSPGTTAWIPLGSGDVKNKTDAGVYKYGGVGDRVWEDTNGDGFQDETEVGVPIGTVTVTLFKPDGTSEEKTVTGGQYAFAGLVPGKYQAKFAIPSGYVFTRQFAGKNPGDKDSDVPEDGDGTTAFFTVVSGVANNDIDLGVCKLGKIGDRVWEDTDGDGLQGATEPPVAGVDVTLTDDWGGKAYKAKTQSDGTYSFPDVRPGYYHLKFGPSSDWRFTRQVANHLADDSDVIPSTIPDKVGLTGQVKLASGVENKDVDAGLYHPATISDFVWEDLDGDGKQGGVGEYGLAGVVVSIYDALNPTNPPLVTLPATTGTGAYAFTEVAPGSYAVRFQLPYGYYFTKQVQGYKTQDSDVPEGESPGRTSAIRVVSGQKNDTIDAGAFKGATISGQEWVDADGDGLRAYDEPRAEGRTVYLYTTGGTELKSTTTHPGGWYEFRGLRPGPYVVGFTRPTGPAYHFTKHRTDFLSTNSDALDDGGKTGQVTVAYGATAGYIDAGYYAAADISGRVWEDRNANGVFEGTDALLSGVAVTVTLYKPDNTTETKTTTAPDYSFTNLPPGDYRVGFSLPTGFEFTRYQEPAGKPANDSDAKTASGQTDTLPLRSGVPLASVDAGVFRRGNLGDFGWDDLDDDGYQTPGEPGVKNVAVTIAPTDAYGSPTRSTQTDEYGKYLFENLIPGSYRVTFNSSTTGAKYFFTQQNFAPTDTDSDPAPDTGKTALVYVLPGQTNRNVDAGLSKAGSVRAGCGTTRTATGCGTRGSCRRRTPSRSTSSTRTGMR